MLASELARELLGTMSTPNVTWVEDPPHPKRSKAGVHPNSGEARNLSASSIDRDLGPLWELLVAPLTASPRS